MQRSTCQHLNWVLAINPLPTNYIFHSQLSVKGTQTFATICADCIDHSQDYFNKKAPIVKRRPYSVIPNTKEGVEKILQLFLEDSIIYDRIKNVYYTPFTDGEQYEMIEQTSFSVKYDKKMTDKIKGQTLDLLNQYSRNEITLSMRDKYFGQAPSNLMTFAG